MESTGEAIAEFEAAAKDCSQGTVRAFRPWLYVPKEGHYDEAVQAFETELDVDPGDAQTMVYLADCEMKLDHPEKALPLLEKAAQLKSNLRLAYFDLGTVLATLKRYPEAAAALQRAVQLDPSQGDAHFRLGRVYQTMGNVEEAKKEFDQASKLYHARDSKEDLAPMMRPASPP